MTTRAFVIKLFLFSLPFLFLVGLYFFWDPFKVLKHYDRYYQSGKPSYVSINKDVVSTENWVNHSPEFQYDSYIFGNSRSIYYQVETWKNCIDRGASQCYHFDASGESLYGICKKISFLDSRNIHIANSLLVIDYDCLEGYKNSEGHLFAKDPKISGQNPLAFQMDCLKDFFDFQFLTAWLDFKLSGKVKDYMKKDFLLDDRPFIYDYVTNEMRQDYFEEMIKKDPQEYYNPRKAMFYNRDTTTQKIAEASLQKPQKILLDTIAAIFKRNSTNYRIVISPLYDQLKLNPADLLFLRQRFGENTVFDFSGINAITNNEQNYYETSHYRPHVANAIMKIIYGGEGSSPRIAAQNPPPTYPN
ncbi:hypothetical protein [Puia dinghuensis]|uniref:Uncharacterized protein n=1 Tax=Puia dinghuensis TaxID=1792502 RepID=A0A8J2UH03_9BACT|nr:hypothetical protein [Puia dinghuensis]GGB16552.1 hypothetical protein GCM10011511_45470 [Puia dinghuensis]